MADVEKIEKALAQLKAERIRLDEAIKMHEASENVERLAERAQIKEAILSLERLARGRRRGPGRPPNWLADVAPPKRRPPDNLPPAAAMRVQRHRNGLTWAVAGRKRPA
jgi:hypothetical protein